MFIRDGIAYAGEPVQDIEVSTARYAGDWMLLVTFSTTARYAGDWILLVTFSTGETRLFDASQLFDVPVFARLENPGVLSSFSIDHGVITWLDGDIDIAPRGSVCPQSSL